MMPHFGWGLSNPHVKTGGPLVISPARRTQKVRGTGNGARWAVMWFHGIMVASTGPEIVTTVLDGHVYRDVSGIILFTVGLYFVLRCPWWGVWVNDEEIIVHSWFVTRRYPLDGDFQCKVVQYEGVLNSGGTEFTGRWEKVLAFSQSAQIKVRPARATLVIGAARAQRQADEVLRRVEARKAGLARTVSSE
jgi:hypothetical protein